MNSTMYTHATIWPCLCIPATCIYAHARVQKSPWLATCLHATLQGKHKFPFLLNEIILCCPIAPGIVVTLAPCSPQPLSLPHHTHLLHLLSPHLSTFIPSFFCHMFVLERNLAMWPFSLWNFFILVKSGGNRYSTGMRVCTWWNTLSKTCWIIWYFS